MKAVRVRFAPSPTGYLHVGGARTLFFNWLFAKKWNGTLVLRIEDTDQARSTRQSEEMILSDVRSLHLDYQEGPDCGGPYAPYRQSERLSIYAQYAQKLIQEGRAYPCFCSDELLTQKREAALKMGRVPHYDGTCAKLSREEVEKKFAAGEKAGYRFRAFQKTYILNDHVRGQVEFKEGMVGDFLITRTPAAGEKEIAAGIGFPVYNFCCVIDDHLMELTHVIRAEEHLSNTVRQLMIYDAFGWQPPEFAHIALVLGTDRQKLSKRSGDVSVHEYIEKGYLPEALLNFLSLLGWWPPAGLQTESGHPEVLSQAELIQSFDLKGLQKAPGVFDLQKLKWMNAFYIQKLPLAELAQRARPFFEQAGYDLKSHSVEWFQGVLQTIRGEVQLLSELPQAAALFFGGCPVLEAEAQSVLADPQAQPVVQALIESLRSQQGPLTADEVVALPKVIGQKTGLKGKSLFMPMRAVTTGRTHGPELKLIFPLLGREKVLSWIEELKIKASL